MTNARPSVVARTRREAKAATVATTGSTARPIVIARQRPEAVVEHAVLLEAGRDVPRIGPVAGGGAEAIAAPDGEHHRADPVTGAPVRAPPREAIGSPEEDEDARAVDDQQHRQLAADERGDEASAPARASRRHVGRAIAAVIAQSAVVLNG